MVAASAAANDENNNSSSSSSSGGGSYQQQRETIVNLYNSGIPEEIIALQLDISQDEVERVIAAVRAKEEEKSATARQAAEETTLASFYLDAVVDIGAAVRLAQSRVWRALKVEPEFNLSMEETQKVLSRLSRSRATLVILYIDIVGSTKMSMTLPVDRLAAIVQAFTQEMSLTISTYGGYVLKYVGDAILAFFLVNAGGSSSAVDPYLPCVNAVNCARSMIKIVKEGVNPILNQYDYPEISVRVGIDFGENVVVQYGWDIHTLDDGGSDEDGEAEEDSRDGSSGKKKEKKRLQLKKPHLDILGYTISIAAKMTTLARPDQIVIGQSVYDVLDEAQKSTFAVLPVSPEVWSYVSDHTGKIYRVYGTKQ